MSGRTDKALVFFTMLLGDKAKKKSPKFRIVYLCQSPESPEHEAKVSKRERYHPNGNGCYFNSSEIRSASASAMQF